MAVKLGSTSISTIKLGSTDVTSAYLGSTLVFSGDRWEIQGSAIFGEASGDNWGEPVSISSNGTRIAAGAFLNDGASGTGGGHVRAYAWTGTQWAQLGSDIDGLGYTSSPSQAAEHFSNVAMSGDGTRVVIGSHSGEFVKVFEYDTSSQDWVQLGSTISESDEGFGQAVAIDSDGDTIVIGAPLSLTDRGTVRVYQYSSSTWSQVGTTINGAGLSYNLGRAVAITADGSTIAIGADGSSNDGSRVSIYENNSGTWSQVGSDIVGDFGDQFGHAIDIADNGARVVIGAYLNDDAGINNGQTQVYDFASGSWSQVGSDINGTLGSYSGYSVSITGDGTQIAVGATSSHSGNGCTKVFELSGSTWSQVGSDIVSGGQGGRGVALSDSNGKIVVGATTEEDPSQSGTQHGSVTVYEYSSTGGDDGGGDGGSSTTYFTPAAGLTSSGTGSAADPIIFSSDLAATNPIVTVGNAESGGYVLIEATVNSGSDGDDDQQLSVVHQGSSVGDLFDTDSWGGSYTFTLLADEDDTLGLARSVSNISTSSVEFRARAGTSVNFSVTRESDDTTNSGQQYVEFSFDAGDFPLDLWGIKVSISGNRVLYGSTTAFSGAVIYQERFTTQPSSLTYNFNRTSATGNTNSSIGDVLDLKRFIVNGEPILRLYSYNGFQLSNLTILVEPVTHLRETVTNYATGTITGAAIAENDD